MELRDILRILWRRRWLLAFCFALGAGYGLYRAAHVTPTYTASAKMFIGPRTVTRGDLTATLSELSFSREFVASYAELLRSRPLAEHVVEELGLDVRPEKLARSIQTNIIQDTRIIEISISSDDPDRAALMVNAVARGFVADQKRLGTSTGGQATLIEPAIAPGAPIGPSPARDGSVGGILGLMLGLGAAFGLEQFDTRIRSREDVESVLAPLPVLAEIPVDTKTVRKAERERQPQLQKDAGSQASEAFRTLRTNVQFLAVQRPIKRLLITSPQAEDGKTTIAVNIAASFAAGGYKTLLVDTDLRRPVIHEYFSLAPAKGLTDLLIGNDRFSDIVVQTEMRNLSVLMAGPHPPNPAELLGSQRMEEVLQEVSAAFDLVIFDTPPALPVTDATVLSASMDGVIIVLRAGTSRRDRALQVAKRFELLGVRVLGAVLNGMKHAETSSYYYYYNKRYEQPEIPLEGTVESVRDLEPVKPMIGRSARARVTQRAAPQGDEMEQLLADIRSRKDRSLRGKDETDPPGSPRINEGKAQ